MPNFKEKLARFVEAEKQAGVDQDLLDRLHEFLTDETLYWDLPPDRRNTFNVFFRDVHSILVGELLSGKFGASIVIDSTLVMVFEVGYRLGIMEAKQRGEP
jgi:hypothetical protein